MKILFYSLGLFSGILISYLYFASSPHESVHNQKQLMEKSTVVESATQKNIEMALKIDMLTEENSELSLTVEHLQSQISKEILL